MRNANIRVFIIAVFSLCLLGLFSCQEKVEYPIVPYIEFQDFSFLMNQDSAVERGLITIYFTDGDGDIGLTDEDSIAPYDYNLFIDYFEYQNGLWNKVTNELTGDTINFYGRIPVITPTGQNKNIKGTIEDTLFLNVFSEHDTFRYEISLRDRALHESNMVVSPVFVMP